MDEKERNQKLVITEIKQAAAEARSEDIFKLTNAVFRNTEIKKSMITSIPVPYTNGNNGHTSTYVQNHSTTETTSEEHI